MRKRWRRKILLWILVTPVVLFFAFLFFERFQGEISLSQFKRQLAAKGETLDVHKLLAPPVPDADNGASELLRLKALLEDGKGILESYPPTMKLVAPGKAMVGFRANSWVDEKVTNTLEEVSRDLATNEQTLKLLRIVLVKPAFDFQLDHSRSFDMRLLHLAPVKSLCQRFLPAVQNSLRNGDDRLAHQYLLAAITIPRVLEHDRIVISELVRIAISSINERAVWEALQADVWTDDQLAQIQEAWEKNAFATNMAQALRVERADGDTYFYRFRKSNEKTFKYMFPAWPTLLTDDEDVGRSGWWQQEFLRKQIYCRVWRIAWLDQDEKFYLEGIQKLIDDKRTGAEMAAGPTEPNWFGLAKPPRQSFYDDWRYGMSSQSLATLSLAMLKAMRAETDRSLVLCAIALKRYSLRYGKSPSDLNALVPEFLPSIPIDYMDGKPIKYRLNTDGTLLLYSVGDDGRDDGGNPAPANPQQTYSWIWRGKDVVWPAPATEAEIARFNATHSGN